MDNCAAHKHANVRTGLASSPFRIHYTPTYSSWLNQVERWFGLITQPTIRTRGRGSFRSRKELTETIDVLVNHYNRSSRPFGVSPGLLLLIPSSNRLRAFVTNFVKHTSRRTFERAEEAKL
jgi:hypothetical protein